MIVQSQAWLILALDSLLAAMDPACTVRLFKNDVTPDTPSSTGDFTPADFDGYADQPLAAWGAAAWDAGSNAAAATAAANVFTAGGAVVAQDIYGYIVMDSGGNFVFGERDPAAPRTIDTPGQTYTLNPKFLNANIP